MNDIVILGTDTDAGKTTLAMLWMASFADDFDYWKPVETGPSDSARVREAVSKALVHAPVMALQDPVAPPLAARREGRTIPSAAEIAGAKPTTPRPLLIETFGSPFSPLNERELQLALIREFCRPCAPDRNANAQARDHGDPRHTLGSACCACLLVASSALGAIGRTLACLHALEVHGIEPRCVVLVGDVDIYAEEQIRQHFPSVAVVSLVPPSSWDPIGIEHAAHAQADRLTAIRQATQLLEIRPTQAEILETDRSLIWHPYTSLRDAPDLVCVGAQDEFLQLADGRRMIDGISSWWTILHGHRHEPLIRELRRVSAEIDHVIFAGMTHPYATALASRLLATLPWEAGARVFYSDDGSTAVEVALKMAYQLWCHRGEPQRRRFVGFEHGYHGDTFGSMAVGRDPVFFGRFEPLLFEAQILPLNPSVLDEHLSRHGQETAAVILEPLVQGAGGMRMHAPRMLREIYDVVRQHDVLFIADEVMTGMGRTGTLWAHRQAEIQPDIVCAGKTIAGGVLPLAATLAAPRVVNAFDTEDRSKTFFHGHSFTAHPLACALGVVNLDQLSHGDGLDPVKRIETCWLRHKSKFEGRPNIRDVRICGSILAVELESSDGYLAEVGKKLRKKCMERNVFLRPLGNVLYSLPPYCCSESSLEKIAETMEFAVDFVGHQGR